MTSPDYASHFSNRNIPFGIGSSKVHSTPQAVSRVENIVLFLSDLASHGLFDDVQGLPKGVFERSTLNEFAALPKTVHRAIRDNIQKILRENGLDSSQFPTGSLEHISQVTLHLPVQIGDFVDFSCSLDHVQNAGRIVINDDRPPPAFFHLPIGYQGRAASLVISNTDIERPMGQFYDKSTEQRSHKFLSKPVIFEASRQVDYELELAAVIGKPLPMRQRLDAVNVDEHIFGFVILNDWSARDIQSLEMAPLGPLISKNFGSSISPWIITLDALNAFGVHGQKPSVDIPNYLQDPGCRTFDIKMQVEILSGSKSTITGRTSIQSLYWTPRQIVAHVASAGSALRTGDLMATGTVTGAGQHNRGCLLELTEGGAVPVKLVDGSERAWLLDGDIVRMTAVAGNDSSGVGFGECVGKLVPCRPRES